MQLVLSHIILLDISLLSTRLLLHPQAKCFPDSLRERLISQPECKRCKSHRLAMGQENLRGANFIPGSGGQEAEKDMSIEDVAEVFFSCRT